MKTKKILSIALMTLLVGAALTGCMNTANEAPVPTPTPTTNYMPQGTATDGSMNNANTQAAFDWKQNAAQIEARIGQISEISEARIVIAGNTALVGIKFNQAYQGELTERIREMVAAEIMAADTNISTVAVTSDPDDVQTSTKSRMRFARARIWRALSKTSTKSFETQRPFAKVRNEKDTKALDASG